MKKGVNLLILLVMVLLVVPTAFGVTSTGHIKLLAVYQEGNEFKGSPADVQLEIKQGSGRVFLETIPLSKVDTQISTRFAKEMACKFAEVDCSQYDFFYTIKSPAGIVGGPSAGGAISALTVALLKDLPIDQNIAMTGTINSGDLIGPVGSLHPKIEAAKEAEIKKVLIPAAQAEHPEENKTNIIEYGKEIGVEVIPVVTLRQALQEITGHELKEEELRLEVPESYTIIMDRVAGELCEQTEKLLKEINVFDLKNKTEVEFEQVTLQKDAQDLTQKGLDAFETGNTYSAASYCFGANVKASTLLYQIKKLTPEEAAEEAKKLNEAIDEFDEITEERDQETITHLQTYMIVKERILEARKLLETGQNDSSTLGYVSERLNSAKAWSTFFEQEGGEQYNLDEESLKGSCEEILGETEERFQYLNLFFPGLLEDLKTDLLSAHDHYTSGEYALCIYLSSKTKSEANIMVTMLGVREEVVGEVIQQKIDAAKRAVTKQMQKGIFPIIAYSYYQYATSLHEEDNSASMLYSEYALGLSDMDIYFEKKTDFFSVQVVRDWIKKYLPTIVFVWGLILGVLLGFLVMREKMRDRYVEKSSTRNNPPKKVKKIKTKTKLRLG